MSRRSARAAAAATAPPARPLDGYSIATSGRFAGTTQAALQGRITALGASIASSVIAGTNLLIATEKDFESNSTKVKAASTHSVPIVSIDWLETTESSHTKADETRYSFASSTSAPAAPTPPVPTPAAALAKTNGAKKRAASTPSPPAPDAKANKRSKVDTQVGGSSIAKSNKVAVSVDEYCPEANYSVYIDDDGLIWDASLNQTNASANNNKFYKVQLIQSPNGQTFKTWTRWGRVGEKGMMALLGDGSLPDAIWNFEKKFKDKSGLKWEDRGKDPKSGKYAYVERNYNPDSDDDDDGADAAPKKNDGPKAESKLEEPVQNLMKLIFNQQYFQDTMRSLNYDSNKLPLGKLSKSAIARGFQALKDLAAVIDNSGSASEVESISNRYYSVIPHAFGRDRPPIISTNDLLKKEIDLLESLSDMKEATTMLKNQLKDDSDIHQLDRQFNGLGMNEMTALPTHSDEFKEISNYLTETKGSTHNVRYAVQDVFRLERNGENERFEKFAKNNSSRKLLWHGSRVTNFAGILGQGLRIAPPEAPVSGYMFGKGIYLADMSSKSANYCCSYNSGGTALLLLCEAELGDPVNDLVSASYTAGDDAKAKGMVSTWGKGRVGPSKWKDAGCVNKALSGVMMPDVTVKPDQTSVRGTHLQYNEYIAYDVAQVRMRYLLRVRMD